MILYPILQLRTVLRDEVLLLLLGRGSVEEPIRLGQPVTQYILAEQVEDGWRGMEYIQNYL
jgi:hypothetical protein